MCVQHKIYHQYRHHFVCIETRVKSYMYAGPGGQGLKDGIWFVSGKHQVSLCVSDVTRVAAFLVFGDKRCQILVTPPAIKSKIKKIKIDNNKN